MPFLSCGCLSCPVAGAATVHLDRPQSDQVRRLRVSAVGHLCGLADLGNLGRHDPAGGRRQTGQDGPATHSHTGQRQPVVYCA